MGSGRPTLAALVSLSNFYNLFMSAIPTNSNIGNMTHTFFCLMLPCFRNSNFIHEFSHNLIFHLLIDQLIIMFLHQTFITNKLPYNLLFKNLVHQNLLLLFSKHNLLVLHDDLFFFLNNDNLVSLTLELNLKLFDLTILLCELHLSKF